jgi:hypothetical protein
VGIDDETPSGRADVSVVVDGKVQASFELIGGNSAPEFHVDVTDATEVKFIAKPVSGSGEAHVDWIDVALSTIHTGLTRN